MTTIKIKSPIMRKPVTIESINGITDSWRLVARGYLPIEFAADSIPEAVAQGMRLLGSLTVDPHYAPSRRRKVED